MIIFDTELNSLNKTGFYRVIFVFLFYNGLKVIVVLVFAFNVARYTSVFYLNSKIKI